MTTPLSVIEVDLDFVIEQNITLEQYCICYLLWQDKQSNSGQDNDEDDYTALTYIYKYFYSVSDNDDIEGWKRADIEYLERKEFLVNNNKDGEYSADMMEVTDKFTDAVIKHKEAFQEIYDLYPRTIEVDGSIIGPLKMCDLLEMTEYYNKVVKTKKKHREVVELLKWGLRTRNLICGVEKFVRSQYWKQLREMREENESARGYDNETVI